MFKCFACLPIALLFCLCDVTAVRGEDEAAGPSATPEQIGQWIAELDNDEFAAREAAQAKLEKAGKPAMDAVREAAMGKSQEAAVRATEILKRHFRGADASLKQAAEAALQSIAESDNTIAAGRATNALEAKPEKSEPQFAQPAVPAPFRPVPFGGGGIRIEARAIAIGGGGRSVTIKNVDGNKEIEVKEKDRKINITESAEGEIKMQVVEKKGDMESTESYEAKNADDLKKLHPEAHKIYEKYSKGFGGGRIEFRGLPADGIKILPVVPRAIPADELKRFKDAEKQLEGARKEMEERMRKALEGADLEGPAKDIAKQLEQVQRQLEANDAIPAEIKQQIKRSLEELENPEAKE